MTAVEVLALLLGAGLLVLLALLIREVRRAAHREDDDKKSLREAAWRATTALELTQANTHRIAVAVEKAASDRPAQVEAKKHAEMSENLVMGISTVLDTTLTHPVGLKDDVIVGREQAEQELKDQLRTELNKALNHTN